MEVFNILKPDMLEDEESINYYLVNLKKKFDISLGNYYIVRDWVNLFIKLYESDLENSNLCLEQLKIKRKQIITTVKGYDLLYKNKNALVFFYEISNDNKDLLQSLCDFKISFRKKYVYNTRKVYIRMLNETKINFDCSMTDIDMKDIKSDLHIVSCNQDFNDSRYSMCYFNKLHFPNPCKEDIEREKEIINNEGIIQNINKVKRLVK